MREPLKYCRGFSVLDSEWSEVLLIWSVLMMLSATHTQIRIHKIQRRHDGIPVLCQFLHTCVTVIMNPLLGARRRRHFIPERYVPQSHARPNQGDFYGPQCFPDLRRRNSIRAATQSKVDLRQNNTFPFFFELQQTQVGSSLSIFQFLAELRQPQLAQNLPVFCRVAAAAIRAERHLRRW